MSRQRCPDCNGQMLDAGTETAFCAYKRTSGYGPCGVPRVAPNLQDAAAALRAVAYGDRDRRFVAVPLIAPDGRRLREWDDFIAAIPAPETD